jgi:hypothetical protein
LSWSMNHLLESSPRIDHRHADRPDQVRSTRLRHF